MSAKGVALEMSLQLQSTAVAGEGSGSHWCCFKDGRANGGVDKKGDM